MVTLELYRTEGLGDEINRKAGVTAASIYRFPANFEIIIELEVDEKKDAVFKSYFENERTKEKVVGRAVYPWRNVPPAVRVARRSHRNVCPRAACRP